MSAVAILIGGALICFSLIAAVRMWDAASWRRSLISYRLRFPVGLTADDVARWLGNVAAVTHAPRGSLLAPPPIVLDVVGTGDGIAHYLSIPAPMESAVLSTLRAGLAGVRLEDRATGPRSELSVDGLTQAAAVRLAGRQRQVAVERAEAASSALLAGLQPLLSGEQIRWQWIITGAGTPPPLPPLDQQNPTTPAVIWLDDRLDDNDGLRAARLKLREPLLHATGRLLVAAQNRERCLMLFGRAWGPIRSLNVPGARLVRALWPSSAVRAQLEGLRLPLLQWPLRLNTKELAGLLAIPMGDAPLPGVAATSSRQLPPVSGSPREGTVLADSTYPGSEQPLAISRRDRLMHVWLGGPTGSGKSTLAASMVLQDADRGDGMTVIDAKGDLVKDVLARMPEHRWDDVVVIDGAYISQAVVGSNLLPVAGDEISRELAVDHVLHIFKQQWADYWGPRTESVLRSAVLTLASTKALDGSAFTLCEIPELLTNQKFRLFVTGQASVPQSVRKFWHNYEQISEAERRQTIGPVMNKLSAFTTRTSLRLLLGQSEGLDFAQAMRDRKIVLVPLSSGLLGEETAALIGSLVTANVWQAALSRAAIPAEQRRPYWLLIDEAQKVVRLPVAIGDMLEMGRGLGLGITLANQHLAQLPDSVKRAVLSTVRSQVVFAVEPDDAKVLARAFEPSLTERDLRSLPAYEVAMRLCHGGQTVRPVTGRTRPLIEPTTDPDELRAASRKRYAMPRAAIEEALTARLQTTKDEGSGDFGRRPRRSSGGPS